MKTPKKSGTRTAAKAASTRSTVPATRSAASGRKRATSGASPRDRDPFLARETQRYDNPLPSREYVMQVLHEQGVPLGEIQLAKLVGVTPAEFEVFSRRLAAMERDGQILRNRRGAIGLMEKMDLLPGRVEGHPDGFGFCIPDNGSADVWLSPREMHQVLHGDRVVVRLKGRDNRGRPEGAIVEVLQRKNRTLVGRIYCENGIWFVAAENRRIAQDILIAPGQHAGAQPGQVVTVELLTQPSPTAEPTARVIEVLGNYGDSGMEIEIALRKHDLPYEFPPEAIKQAGALPAEVRKTDLRGREDLRQLPLVTIDGETAKDFDDAVWCEPKGKDWRLLVAIADVSHYVQPGDALDKEAVARGNSVYFPRRVIPMLPEALSNGLCSLNPAVDRLCMVCDMHISAKGEIGEYRFYPAVMHSQARLTYTRVWNALSGGPLDDDTRRLLPELQNLDTVFKALLGARAKRGAIDFETTETQILFTKEGRIERVVPVVRNDAHRLIEECMLAANVCAADLLIRAEHPALYRVHDGPALDRLEKLRAFMSEFGLGLGGGDKPSASDYGKLLSQVRERPDASLLQTVMLRSLSQAVYSPENIGHFGLAYEAYAHFTSPIRRYPDLLVHRAIKAVVKKKAYDAGDWNALGNQCSMTERRADEASRDVLNWLKCTFMSERVGEVFAGTVSAVTGFGIFVTLDEVFIEGLVHISELGTDYFHFEADKHRLLGERTGRQFRLGDRLTVQVVRADVETTRIDFSLVEGAPDVGEVEPTAAGKGRGRGRKAAATGDTSRPAAGKPAGGSSRGH
ncbi:MAG: ribonuclease R [Burkholderiales bacterium]|jgi:ribonuclease R